MRQIDDRDVDFVVRVDLDPACEPIPGAPHLLWSRVTAVNDLGHTVRAGRAAPVDPAGLSEKLRKEMAADGPVTRNAGNLLLPGPVLAAYHAAVDRAQRHRAHLRICLLIQDDRLASVPWELAAVPERRDGATGPAQFLVRHHGVSVVRGVATGTAVPSTAHPLDLRGTLLLGTALTVEGGFRTGDGSDYVVEALETGTASAAETRAAAGRLGRRGGRDVRVLPEPLTEAALRQALDEPVWGVFFAGHGHRDGIVLAGADGGADFMPGSELAPLLASAGVAVVVLAACGTAAPANAEPVEPIPRAGRPEPAISSRQQGCPAPADAGSSSPSLAEYLVRSGIPYVLGMDGLIGDRHAMALTGRFFDTLAWGGSVDQAVDDARGAMAHDWWQPVVHTRLDAPRHLAVPAPESPAPSTLCACHVPPDWGGERPHPLPGSGRPARLDTLWCLDRGPLRGILVEERDTPDADADALTHQLNDVETGPLRLLTHHGGVFPRRHWFTVRTPWADPQRDSAEFAHGLARPEFLRHALASDPAGGRVGLVLPFSVGEHHPGQAVRYARSIADCYPAAAVVVRLSAPRLPRALRAATEIAAGMPDRRPDGSALGVNILLRPRPSGPAASPPPPHAPPASALSPLDVALALAPASRSAGADRAGSLLAEEAGEAIRNWQQRDAVAGPRSPEEAWRAELASLVDLTDHERVSPEFLAALLAEHARSRVDPVRSASLFLVCEDDDRLDAWLDAAGSVNRPVIPAALPAGDWKAVLLGELRRAPTVRQVRAVAQRWHGLIPRTVQAAVDHLATPGRDLLTPQQRTVEDLAFLEAVRDPAVAEAALRAGIGAGLALADLPDGDPPPAVWVLLSRMPLDAPTAERMLRWSVSLRRVLGYTSDPVETDAEVRDRVAVFHQALRPWLWTTRTRAAVPVSP
ncbi:CHAT domain-containing protein [Streptomyces sp. NPDC004250]|uniref:CHAT domain-containing protein n=1 Tax=Streptomyces sp. NPDC004250 TaxID=3364692 RepID=UPI0036C84536